jgi:hypothetical protein
MGNCSRLGTHCLTHECLQWRNWQVLEFRFAAKQSFGLDLWLSWRDAPCKGAEADSNALFSVLRESPNLERIPQDRIDMQCYAN